MYTKLLKKIPIYCKRNEGQFSDMEEVKMCKKNCEIMKHMKNNKISGGNSFRANLSEQCNEYRKTTTILIIRKKGN